MTKEDPRVTAKKKEVHEQVVATVTAIQEAKMRVVNAHIAAVRQTHATQALAVNIARHQASAATAAAQAHAKAAGDHIAKAKAAQAKG